MSDTKNDDPLRRKAPTIDLKATEVRPADAKPGEGKVAEGKVVGGKTGETQTGAAKAADVKAGDAEASASKPGTDKPGDGKPAPTKAGLPDGVHVVSAAPKAGPTTVFTTSRTTPAGSAGQPAAAAGLKVGDGPVRSEDEAKTAIEPMATTGLDGGKAPKVEAARAVTGPPVTGGAGTPKTEPKADKPKIEPVAGAAAPASAIPVVPAKAKEPDPVVAPKPKEGRRGVGFGGFLAASVIGGLIGAALLFVLEPYLRESDPAGTRIAALEQRLNAVGNQGALNQRIAALETGRADLARANAETRAVAEAAAKQASELAGRPVAVAPTAPPPQADPALPNAIAALRDRVGAGEQVAGRTTQLLAELGQKVDAWHRQTEERVTTTATGLAALQAGTSAIPSAMQALQTSSAAIQAALQALQGSVGGLANDTKGLQARLGEQAGRIDTAAAELAKLSPPAIQAGLRVAVAARLDDALRSGGPLGPAVAALEKLGADAAAIAALKPFAQTPPPSIGALARDFGPIADRILAVPSTPPTSFTDRLMRVADKIVTVRSLGDGSGTDVPGLVARIQAALAGNRAPEALAAWNALPDSAKTNSAGWADTLKARVAVEDAARRVGASALAALDSATR